MKRLLLLVLCLAMLILAAVGSQSSGPPAAQEKPMLATGAIQPRLSPDGSTIVFSYQGAIWTTPRQGGTMTRLTNGDGFDLEPAWSPDGKKIAFVRSPYRGGEVRLVSADGQDIPLPKAVQARTSKLEFHPDGRRLLGVFRQEGKDYGPAWYDLATGALQSLAPPLVWHRFALAPDGQSIVFTRNMDVPGQQTGNDGPQTDLWKVPATGGTPEKIVRFPARIHDLCWEADGQGLIVVSELGGVYYDLWQMPLADSLPRLRKLTMGQADEDRPSVSRDGRWLVYTDNRAGPTSLMVRQRHTDEEQTVPITRLDFRSATGTIRLALKDGETKKPLVGRVSLLQEGGKFHAPVGALYRVLRDQGHFYCGQTAEWVVPAGKYRLRVWRGPEYQIAYRDVHIQPGQTHDLAVDLVRWTHQAKKGWYSGENHIHANYGYGQWYNTPQTMLLQCAGEDLNVCNFMVANSDTDGVFDRPFFRGGPDPLSTPETILYWNQEFRSTLWGHMTLVNLRQIVEPIMTGFKDTTNPWDIPTNADIADRTHWQKGHVNYTHAVQNADEPLSTPYAGKGLPVDVALGKIDSLDINHSYAGTVPVWHRLLNCGFRLPATAGTDCFLNRIYSQLPGGDRVYVQIKGEFTYANWMEGLRAGRSFVTNGPMLLLKVDKQNQYEPGDAIRLAGPRKLTVEARAKAQFPLAKVELLYNGQVVATGTFDKPGTVGTIEQELLLDRSGWLALRATGAGHPDSPLPMLYAHTNPIYVEVQGSPFRSRADALFFVDWIDKLSLMWRGRDRVPTEELRRHVQNQLETARAIYARLAKEE